jgi:autotransporter-associated beta strand protein/T5SS/PEP-CTERM-associated repeat protein
MGPHPRLRPSRHIPIFFVGVAFIGLTYGVIPTCAQTVYWTLPVYGSLSAPNTGNWFDAADWSTTPSPQSTTFAAAGPPNSTQIAIVGNSPSANISAGGAVANELIVNQTDVSGRFDESGSVPISPSAGQVIVNGKNASLSLSGTNLPVSLDVQSGSVLIENGGKLTTSGSGVGRVAFTTPPGGVAAPPKVSVLGSGSLWIENGTLSIGLLSQGQVVIADGGSFQGTKNVIVGTLGQINIGTGGLAGTFNAPTITNNGVIHFDFTDTTTLSAQVSGSGQILKDGIGTVILTGNNTYSGGTTINAGTLQLGNGGTTGSLTGNVIDDGILAFNRSDSVTYHGVISGGGSVQQNGTGTTVLVMDNTYTGTTTVNAGTLIVDGSISSTQTVVNPGGLLGGNGSLLAPVVSPGVSTASRRASVASAGGSLVNSGIVSPGDPVGTLTVSGNYIQNADGTLRINFASGQHSVLRVLGQATLAGTLQLIRLGPFQLQVGDKLTFLTAKGGVSGTFSTIQNPFISNTIVKAQVVILPNEVQLLGTQGSFTEAACNPNSLAVARVLDSVVGDPRAAGLINFLNSQPVNQLCGDFQLIAPEELTSMYNIGFSVENVQTDNLNRRMNNVRAGSTGFSSEGFTMNGVAPTYSSGLAGPTGTEGKTGPSVLAPVPENRWGVFATGLGEFTHVDSTDGASGFDLQTGGVTVGVDYRIGSNFAVGLLAGYAHTNADLVNNGNLDVNSAKFGLYATAFSGGFYLNSAVTGGWSEYDSHRTALLGTASGSTDGGDINVLVSAGYDWRKGNLSIGPTASFQYNYLSFNGFTESGSLAPLKFNDQHSDSIRTAFGMKATYDWKVGKVLVRPELRAAWQHEYGLSAYPIVASFADGAGSSFTVSGPKIGRDSLLLGAGAAILWNDRIATYIYYDGELGRTNFDSHNISGGIRVTF